MGLPYHLTERQIAPGKRRPLAHVSMRLDLPAVIDRSRAAAA
jgi:hypothetical protein